MSNAFAQDSTPQYLEYKKLQRPSETIGALGENLFGEQTDFYSGQTTFRTIDVSIPGNSALPVEFSRIKPVDDTDGFDPQQWIGDWQLDAPSLSGIFETSRGWIADGATPNSRCSSGSGLPPTVHFTYYDFLPSEYWKGYQLHVPGQSDQELLLALSTTQNRSNAPARWTTRNHWLISCLPSATGYGTGEGFIATAPDGTKYYFDRIIKRPVDNWQSRLKFVVGSIETGYGAYTCVNNSWYDPVPDLQPERTAGLRGRPPGQHRHRLPPDRGRMIAKRVQPLTATGNPTGTATVKYLHTDALGSVIAESDATGKATRIENFMPYGEPTDQAYDPGPGFTGHATDALTGLTYMQQRYYDPALGRFLSPDPVTTDADTGANFSRYWYAANNPFKFTDPDGQQEVPVEEEEEERDRSDSSADSFRNDLRRMGLGPRPILEPIDVAAEQDKSESDSRCVGPVENLEQDITDSVNPTQRGRTNETSILDAIRETKNSEPYTSSFGKTTIADWKNDEEIGEIKDTKRASDTAQIRAQREEATRTGRAHIVLVGARTHVTRPLENSGSVVLRRNDLGPSTEGKQ